jgi:TPR repeat protein
MLTHLRTAALIFVLVPSVGAALDFNAGLRAYNAGNFRTALNEWRPLALQGNARAQNNLGFMYENGRGVDQDDAEAVRWYRQAAEQGDAIAQINLGFMYANGRGVAQDDAEALRWYRRAAEQENARAQNNVGFMYENGRGVAQDDAEATRWYRRAAEQGNAIAQINLGFMYENGRGVAQDDVEATRWYRLAAEQGDARAQINLGIMYRDLRLPVLNAAYSRVLAHMWFNIAATNGYRGAARRRDGLAQDMTSADITQAQGLAQICMETNYQNCAE